MKYRIVGSSEWLVGTVNITNTPTYSGAFSVQVSGSGEYDFTGFYQDLKYFSLRADDVEVFSGNKTGIDTLKPGNYTLVGSPTISPDGMYTASEGNYIKSPSIDFASAYTWEVRFKFLSRSTSGNNYCIFGKEGLVRVNIQATNEVNFLMSGPSIGWAGHVGTKKTELNTLYYGRAYFDGSSYKVDLSTDNKNWDNYVTYTNANKIYSTDFSLGYNYNGLSQVFTNPMDLNAFKVYLNDSLVYQPCLKIPYTQTKDGKKIVDEYYRYRVEDEITQATFTPYYTLQSDSKGNYAVVGAPTINTGFVATGFDANNYLKSPIINQGSKFELIVGFILTSNTDSDCQMMASNANQGIDLTTNNNRVGFNIGNGSNWVSGNISGTTALSLNTKYYMKFLYKYGYYKLLLSQDMTNWTTEVQYASATNFLPDLPINIGTSRYPNTTASFTGSIDLKDFKIYVDDQLIYQAVTPPNHTMATNKPQDIIYTYQNGSNKYTQKANLQLEEYGTCTGTTPVTFTKPFRDENYALTVPYSAKTKTGFTPNVGSGVTRDWKAKGFYSL